MRTRTTRSYLAASALLAALTTGCSEISLTPVETEAEADDLVPSVVVSADQLEEAFTERDGRWVSRPLAAPEGATRVAFSVDLRLDHGDAAFHLEARGITAGGEAGPWVPAEVTWREAPYAVARADLGLVATEVEVRLPVEDADVLHGLAWEAVTPFESESLDEEPADDVSLAQRAEVEQGLASDLASLGVVSRGTWGARATRCTSQNATKTRMAVHHTVTSTTYNGTYAARIRQIQAFHMDGRGWCDVGYHFLVTTDGRVWEGRPVHLLGAHVGNHNTNNVGVSFVGCFHSSQCSGLGPTRPPEVMIEGGARIIKRLSERYGIPRDASHVKGHRDHSGAQTSCPGDHLHARLRDLRSGFAVAPPPPPPPAPAFEGCREVTRIAGATRYATSARLSEALFPNGADVVVLTSGSDASPDSLVAGPLAKTLRGPVLLVQQDGLPASVRREIVRLGATRAVVVGGAAVVSAAVADAVRALGLTVERTSGQNRYQTAAAVARRIGGEAGVAFIVSGDDEHLIDGLSAAAAAAGLRAPLLYVRDGGVPPATASALADLGITRTYVVGGESAIPRAVVQQLPSPIRIAGANRYQTAVAVAEAARILGVGVGRPFLSRGDRTPDAVAAAASGRVLLLSASDRLPGAPRDFLRQFSRRAILVGGKGALAEAVEERACNALR